MLERMHTILFANSMMKASARSMKKWLCPCHPYRAIGSADCKPTYIIYFFHVILKILLTIVCGKYLLSKIRALKAHFTMRAIHWMLEIVAYSLAVWFPLRLIWPNMIFVIAELAKDPLEQGGTLLRLKIKPCSNLMISILTCIEAALAFLAILLLLLFPISYHLWKNFDRYLRKLRNFCHRFHIPLPRFTWLRNFFHRYFPNCLRLRCFARLAYILRNCFRRIPGLAWLRNCFSPEFPIISGLLNLIRRSGFPPPWLRTRPYRCIGAYGCIDGGMNSWPSHDSTDRSSSPGRKAPRSTSTVSTRPSGSAGSPSPGRKSANRPSGSKGSSSPGRKSANQPSGSKGSSSPGRKSANQPSGSKGSSSPGRKSANQPSGSKGSSSPGRKSANQPSRSRSPPSPGRKSSNRPSGSRDSPSPGRKSATRPSSSKGSPSPGRKSDRSTRPNGSWGSQNSSRESSIPSTRASTSRNEPNRPSSPGRQVSGAVTRRKALQLAQVPQVPENSDFGGVALVRFNEEEEEAEVTFAGKMHQPKNKGRNSDTQ